MAALAQAEQAAQLVQIREGFDARHVDALHLLAVAVEDDQVWIVVVDIIYRQLLVSVRLS